MPKKQSKVKVLFICTGNIFRSLSAEYCLKDYLKKHKIKNIEVSSAGTVANIRDIPVETKKQLLKRGIDPSKHKQRRLTKKILEENDIIIIRR